jgi:dephospho-CoA kinase
MANAIAINNGAGKSGGISVIEKTDAGVIDINKDSVAKRVFDQIVKAQGLDVVSTDITMKRKVAQAMMFAQSSVGAFEASLAQPETYKTKYTNKFITVAGLQ